MKNEGKVLQVDISNEMKKCYIDYAMSVIIDRALPDVRDGLKPVHRRIIYSMHELGLSPEKGYRKCARIVGDVLGKYHPHGDSSVYGALVRMAQDFNLRYPLVDGHGNFGSVDGDSPAAMRYTEAKMSKIAMEMVRDINKNTVDFIPNFDGEEQEPVIIPSRFPNLLVNGSAGIAVGMATNIPPHNLNEVIDGIFMLIDNKDISILELMTKIKGPDFPTAGSIIGKSGIRNAYETGRGKIVLRAKSKIEEVNGRTSIIVTELPYQVNKARLVESIANLVKEKKITGISDLRDESDRDGMRMVIELKRDANPQVILNQLYKHTKLQDGFGIIMLALVDGKPQYLNLKQMLVYYLEFQEDIIRRRTQFELDKANARAHILEGLKIALDNIDEVINIIRSSKAVSDAQNRMIEKFNLSQKQAEAIVEMKLRRLTGLEREKIEDELAQLMKDIEYYTSVLGDEQKVLSIIKDELLQIKAKYGDERRTIIENVENEIEIEDLIEDEDVVITLTHAGYIKRIPADTYSAQKRGGRGIQAMSTKEDDFVEHIFITSTHKYILFFSNQGRVYSLKGYQVPEAGRTAKGVNLINLLQLDQGEKVQAVITLREFDPNNYLIMGTKNGIIKKTSLDQYSSIRKNGLNAINLRDGDELISVRFTTGDSEIIMLTKQGYAIRFSEKDARPLGRVALGVKGITLREDDIVVGMEIINPEEKLLVVSENGFGKRTEIHQYTLQRRGGKGVITYKVNDKTGELVGARMVNDSNELMLINSNGVAIRINASDISTTSRNAMGVTLMKTTDNEKVVAIAKINIDVKDDLEDEENKQEENKQED
ncbi:MAG: DNA gyrase subunit A [Clostridium sp.]|nr:DNA gyrase subunit A [Clostridium sp.]